MGVPGPQMRFCLDLMDPGLMLTPSGGSKKSIFFEKNESAQNGPKTPEKHVLDSLQAQKGSSWRVVGCFVEEEGRGYVGDPCFPPLV